VVPVGPFDAVSALALSAEPGMDDETGPDDRTPPRADPPRADAPVEDLRAAAGVNAAVGVMDVFPVPWPRLENTTKSMQEKKSMRWRVEMDGMAQSPQGCIEGVPEPAPLGFRFGYRHSVSSLGGRK